MKKKLFVLLLCVTMLFSTISIYAETTEATTETTTEQKTDSGENNEAFKSALETCLGHTPSDKEIYNYSTIITMLKADGETDIAIAGILGNVLCEGSTIYAIEGYWASPETEEGVNGYGNFEDGGTYHFTGKPAYDLGNGKYCGGIGHGIVQWSNDRATGLFTYAKDKSSEIGFTYVSCYHYFIKNYGECQRDDWDWSYIPDVVGQCGYMVIEFAGDYASVKSTMNSKTDERDASKYFCDNYEMPYNPNYTERGNNAENSLKLVQAHTGTIGSGSKQQQQEQKEVQENMGQFLVTNGYWQESQLMEYNRLVEINIDSEYLDNANRGNYTEGELKAISNWEQNNNKINEEKTIVKIMRKVMAIFAIALSVWAILLYCAYHLDRLNNFIDIDLVALLTLGKLRISDDEADCTFKITDKENLKKQKTVNHITILEICVTCIIFSVLILTGVLYKAIFKLIIWVSSLFK